MDVNKKTVTTIIPLWIIIALYYCFRMPYDQLTYDFNGHLIYTEIVSTLHRLPETYEGLEAFQPPLYYLINSVIFPSSFYGDKVIHINTVRLLSVLYGSVSIFFIAYFLNQVTKRTNFQILTLLFLITTPTFVFMFSTYNNDSMLIMFSIISFALGYKLNEKWTTSLGIILLLVLTAALYTKLIAIIPMTIIFLCCCVNLLKKKLPSKNQLLIMSIISLSFILFSPWLYFHNYKKNKELFPVCPSFAKEQPNKKIDSTQLKNLLGVVFKIPKLQVNDVDYTHEWDDPWQHNNWSFAHPATKRFDYWGCSFVVSLVGECIFHTPDVMFIWIIFWIHLFAYFIGLRESFKSNLTKFSLFAILIGHLFQIKSIMMFPDLPHRAMGYRYISWSWIAWAILYISALSNESKMAKILSKAMVIGIVVQLYILMTVTGEIS